MAIDVKYIGTQARWPELAYTGKQSVWFPGQEEERSDAEAAQLLATGLFSRSEQPLSGAELAATRSSVSGGLPSGKLAVLGTSIESLTLDSTGLQALADGALNVANYILGAPWSVVDDYGVSSDTSGPSTTAQANPGMTTRVATILAGGYGWCYVGFPINDVSQSSQYGLDPDTFTIVNMRSIYTQLIAAGVRVIASTGTPYTSLNANTAGGQAGRVAYAKIQNFIRSFVASNSSMCLAAEAMALTDPATGVAIASPAVTKDGLHPNYEGAMRKALAIVDAVQSSIRPQDTTCEALYDPRQYAPNPFLQGDNASGAGGALNGAGANFTGTIPNGCGITKRATGTAVGSRATARSGSGTTYWKQPAAGFRLAVSATASFDGVGVLFGGDATNGIGRYDQNWAATTAYTYGKRVNPTSANGFIYTLVTPGTTGGTEPSWATAEGGFTTDGTVVWMAQTKPISGMQFYAQAEIETSGLTSNKGAVPRLHLTTVDTTGTIKEETFANWVDLSAVSGIPARYLPPKMRLRTPILTMASGYSLRYLQGELYCYAEAGASVNMDVFRCDIVRVY